MMGPRPKFMDRYPSVAAGTAMTWRERWELWFLEYWPTTFAVSWALVTLATLIFYGWLGWQFLRGWFASS